MGLKVGSSTKIINSLTITEDGSSSPLLDVQKLALKLDSEDFLLFAGSDSIAGTSGSDVLNGEAGKDKIIGGAGNDLIYGGSGSDNLTGGEGADQFVFDTVWRKGEFDTITDFVKGTDSLAFDTSVYTGLAGITADNFSTDTHLYYNGKGKLYYDPTGGTHSDMVQIAAVAGLGTTLNYADLYLFHS